MREFDRELFIDIETYSSVDIKDSGAYKYIASPDFEILICGYAFGDDDVIMVDLASGDKWPEEFLEALRDPKCLKVAHNAVFERTAFNRIGLHTETDEWYCTLVKAAYCGLPLSLDAVSKQLNLQDKKLDTGKALIKYFSCPCKPTKINGGRTRNMPDDAPGKWAEYKLYNIYDVLSEREIYRKLEKFEIPEIERQLYVTDQNINDRGIMIDRELAESAIYCDEAYSKYLMAQAKSITHLENPKSPLQIKKWIKARTGITIDSLVKAEMPTVLERVKDYPEVVQALDIYQKLSKTSVKKYYKMIACSTPDDRVRGTFQFYGANRTGRWAGRLLQLQNLSKNHVDDIDTPRELIRKRDWETCDMMYGNVADVLSQLVRTALIAPEGYTFSVADFSAIEARVVSWLANEKWRMDVFHGDGKIYEATGSKMFGVPISAITKGSVLRDKSKISELALGYGGSLGALERMGGEKMGLTDAEMMDMVRKWRTANPKIVALWSELEKSAHEAVKYQRPVKCTCRNIIFDCDGEYLTVRLPSGRQLFYVHPHFKNKTIGRSTKPVQVLMYEGQIQTTGQWGEMDTYGGKLCENCLASGTVVITNHGPKYIENIAIDDLIWDGEEFVQHEGLIDKGVQLVKSLNGIYVTSNHKVLTTENWKTRDESVGFNWKKVSLPDSYRERTKSQEWKDSVVVPMCMWKKGSLFDGRINKSKQTIYSEVLWLYEKEATSRRSDYSWYEFASSIHCLAHDASKMPKSKQKRVEKLWRKRHKGMRKMGPKFRGFLGGYGFNLQTWVRYRQNRQFWRLLSGKLQVGNKAGKHFSQKNIRDDSAKWRADYNVRIFQKNWNIQECSQLQNKIGLALRELSNTCRCDEQTRYSQVWDLKNCGPKHRFVVLDEYGMPRIVHNCVQAIARDLLGYALMQVEKAGFKVDFHVHDEMIAEIPKDGNEKATYDLMVQLMSTPPEWASDLPLRADGYITDYYRKD